MSLSKKPILLFETIKVQNFEAKNLEFHIKRAQNSVRENLKFDFNEVIKVPNNGLFRTKIIYDELGNFISSENFSYKARNFSSFKVLKSKISYERKFLDRSEINELFLQKGDCSDIIVDKNGVLTDTSIANIAIFLHGIWITPKSPLLKGTTRERLLQIGFLKELDFGISELLKADKFAILNAMLGFFEIKNAKFEIN
ncbi:putative chorismate binding enzyme [Campylobacter sputorum subsp. bubulus]|uniref:Putative chorismate binding enzyme n=1 Tax=Campylobacter sputorum subsp. sputorum TaxID=32024 RepID=A0A381DIX1_9BACT|nr:aminotransferase class IV [Campylobacter sputorum]ASM35616.1 branched-chain amino acid aminotransferase, possible 4-amino-4-deoxychorismate lyase PabC [Campylobacter sputorum aubsp. sputorum RM3237]ASM37334.1 branched-chain amino acid aminotransferase, possible 4-amino-4-deoxychorismate lyase PabC [Campylobacter sputorum bv. faecalis CCUG 20703]ASM38999.1 branched-chain amino acid aminotransferase, possible 4-amino-4-deoxychorismate lyase PabC [Campylobacter sputorum bv. paraureolyticus LMG 1